MSKNKSFTNYDIYCMGFIYLLKGIAIGFSLAAPVGPIGVLCIRRTLAHGSRFGLIVGLSAASADMLYGIVAAFGITLVSDFIYIEQQWIRLVGGVILLALGYHTIRSHPSTDTATNETNGQVGAFFSVFLLTLTNPMTLFAFAAVFASIGLQEIVGNRVYGLFLVAGIFLGSMSWFALLTTLVHVFKDKINTGGISHVNKIAGSILMLFGIIALCSSLIGLLL